MSFLLPQLTSAYAVDMAIQSETEKVVMIRFGKVHTKECMLQDITLSKICEMVKEMALVYSVNIEKVVEFNDMYELFDPTCLMFFYRNKHIRVDCGTGNNNKIDWPLTNKQDLIDIVETVYRGAVKGKGLVNSPKSYSCRFEDD